MNDMILETERLSLRELTQEDFDGLCKIIQDEKTMYAYEVCSIIRDTNLASQGVAKRNGMTPDETWVKHFRGVDMPHIRFVVKKDR